MNRLSVLLLGLAAAGAAQAQVVRPCDQLASALNIYEPWEENSRTFADGAIRVAELDTDGEPAGLSARLLFIAPGEPMEPTCAVIAQFENGHGWADIDIQAIDARYDPAQGLELAVPVTVIDENGAEAARAFSILYDSRDYSLRIVAP